MEKKKQNPQHKSLKKTLSKKSVATKKSSVATAKRKNANETHWIESRARLVKIMEAAGFAPEKCAIMITHRKRPDSAGLPLVMALYPQAIRAWSR